MMKEYLFPSLSIQQYVFPYINSNMYLILEENSALIVDPHENEEVLDVLHKKGVKEILILLSHEHPDHTSGVNILRRNFDTTLICQENCAAYIAVEKNNRPILISFILAEKDKKNGTNTAEMFNKAFPFYQCKAEIVFDKTYSYKWLGHKLNFISIPGHSSGSSAIIFDGSIVFSGDSLINGIETITRFPGGNIRDYKDITIPFFKGLDRNIFVLPGHGQGFKLKDYIGNVQF